MDTQSPLNSDTVPYDRSGLHTQWFNLKVLFWNDVLISLGSSSIQTRNHACSPVAGFVWRWRSKSAKLVYLKSIMAIKWDEQPIITSGAMMYSPSRIFYTKSPSTHLMASMTWPLSSSTSTISSQAFCLKQGPITECPIFAKPRHNFQCITFVWQP